jgi:hypothetical protein
MKQVIWRAPASIESAAAPDRSGAWTISRLFAVPEGNTWLPLHGGAVESRPINPIYGRPISFE